MFTGWSCISYFCWVELFSNPLLLGGSRFAMFSQVEEDFDDVFTVGAVLIFLQRRGLPCYQDIFCLRGICNHIFLSGLGSSLLPFPCCYCCSCCCCFSSHSLSCCCCCGSGAAVGGLLPCGGRVPPPPCA